MTNETVEALVVAWNAAGQLATDAPPVDPEKVADTEHYLNENYRKDISALTGDARVVAAYTENDPPLFTDEDQQESDTLDFRRQLITEFIGADAVEVLVGLLGAMPDECERGALQEYLVENLAATGQFEAARKLPPRLFPNDVWGQIRAYESIAFASRNHADIDILRAIVIESIGKDAQSEINPPHDLAFIWMLSGDQKDLDHARQLAKAIAHPVVRARAFKGIARHTHQVADFLDAVRSLKGLPEVLSISQVRNVIIAIVLSRRGISVVDGSILTPEKGLSAQDARVLLEGFAAVNPRWAAALEERLSEHGLLEDG